MEYPIFLYTLIYFLGTWLYYLGEGKTEYFTWKWIAPITHDAPRYHAWRFLVEDMGRRIPSLLFLVLLWKWYGVILFVLAELSGGMLYFFHFCLNMYDSISYPPGKTWRIKIFKWIPIYGGKIYHIHYPKTWVFIVTFFVSIALYLLIFIGK